LLFFKPVNQFHYSLRTGQPVESDNWSFILSRFRRAIFTEYRYFEARQD